jgi:hypothetical protein
MVSSQKLMFIDYGFPADDVDNLSVYMGQKYRHEIGEFMKASRYTIEIFGGTYQSILVQPHQFDPDLLTIYIYDYDNNTINAYINVHPLVFKRNEYVPFHFGVESDSITANFCSGNMHKYEVKGEGIIFLRSWGANLQFELKLKQKHSSLNEKQTTYLVRLYGGRTLDLGTFDYI